VGVGERQWRVRVGHLETQPVHQAEPVPRVAAATPCWLASMPVTRSIVRLVAGGPPDPLATSRTWCCGVICSHEMKRPWLVARQPAVLANVVAESLLRTASSTCSVKWL
jgi:hypothetical protein